jgi:hypothetical protein
MHRLFMLITFSASWEITFDTVASFYNGRNKEFLPPLSVAYSHKLIKILIILTLVYVPCHSALHTCVNARRAESVSLMEKNFSHESQRMEMFASSYSSKTFEQQHQQKRVTLVYTTDTKLNYYYFQMTKHDVTNRLPASQSLNTGNQRKH